MTSITWPWRMLNKAVRKNKQPGSLPAVQLLLCPLADENYFFLVLAGAGAVVASVLRRAFKRLL